MEIVKHSACVGIINPPADMEDGSCSGLPFALVKDEHGTWTVSFWKPDEHDLKELVDKGLLTLYVRSQGRQHPVVGIGTCPASDEAFSHVDLPQIPPLRYLINAAIDFLEMGGLQTVRILGVPYTKSQIVELIKLQRGLTSFLK